MKKTLIVAPMLLLALVSCKKDRVCECTNTSASGSSSVVSTTTTSYTKIKKSDAVFSCQKITSTSSGNGNTSTYTSDCKLK